MSTDRSAAAWGLVTPALAAIAIFFALPVLAALALSFTDFDLYALADLHRLRFVGLANYARLVQDERFWIALRNTSYFVFVGGPLSIAISLLAALALDARAARWQPFFRTVFLLPVVTTLIAVAVVWRYLYHPRVGLLNHVLAWFGVAPIDWLGDPRWAMPAIIVLAVWKNFGFNTLIFLAGLQTIPRTLYEAAELDGANAWQQLRRVTVPMLAPTLLLIGVLTLAGYFQLFAEPYVMTSGGPGSSTLSVVLLMYEQGFRWWNLGYAAAVAFVLFAIILTFTALELALRRRADVTAPIAPTTSVPARTTP